MSDDLTGEVRALGMEIQALTRGLLMQHEMLRTMDEKLTCLLQAATMEDGENELQQLLARIVEGIKSLAEGQTQILNLLRPPLH